MVLTIIEANVPREKWEALKQGFEALQGNRPSDILQGFLTQNTEEPTQWRLIGFWRSREALETYRHSVQTMPAAKMFRDLGLEPTFSTFDVAGQSSQGPGMTTMR